MKQISTLALTLLFVITVHAQNHATKAPITMEQFYEQGEIEMRSLFWHAVFEVSSGKVVVTACWRPHVNIRPA